MFCRYPNQSNKLSFLEAITISTSAIFAVTIKDANDLSTKASGRLVLFVIFICGSLFFYVYGGSLTSVLAIPSEYKPFDSPEGILKTSYK